jgi:hypothetical protein
MEALYKALMIKWNSNSAAELRVLCKGGLWTAEGIRSGTNTDRTGIGLSEAYIIYSSSADASTKTMSSVIEEPTIDFLVCIQAEDGSQLAAQIRDEFIAVFDDVDLPMDKTSRGVAQRMVSMTRQNVGTVAKDPNQGWIVPISYNVMYG